MLKHNCSAAYRKTQAAKPVLELGPGWGGGQVWCTQAFPAGDNIACGDGKRGEDFLYP